MDLRGSNLCLFHLVGSKYTVLPSHCGEKLKTNKLVGMFARRGQS